MRPSGILLILVGAWIATQVLAGNALERLNLIKADPNAPVQAPGLAPDPPQYSQGTSGGPPGPSVGQPQGTKQ